MVILTRCIVFHKIVPVTSNEILLYVAETGCVLCEVETAFYSLRNLYKYQFSEFSDLSRVTSLFYFVYPQIKHVLCLP
jgi:hypothetical protein